MNEEYQLLHGDMLRDMERYKRLEPALPETEVAESYIEYNLVLNQAYYLFLRRCTKNGYTGRRKSKEEYKKPSFQKEFSMT